MTQEQIAEFTKGAGAVKDANTELYVLRVLEHDLSVKIAAARLALRAAHNMMENVKAEVLSGLELYIV